MEKIKQKTFVFDLTLFFDLSPLCSDDENMFLIVNIVFCIFLILWQKKT